MESTDEQGGLDKGLDGAKRPRSLRVLLVEDHPDTLRALELFLKMLGHRPTLAKSMQEALQVGCAEDGKFELLLQLRERGCCPKRAIAVSGWGSEEDRARSHAAGFEAHLVKPFTPSVLEAALSRR